MEKNKLVRKVILLPPVVQARIEEYVAKEAERGVIVTWPDIVRKAIINHLDELEGGGKKNA